MVGNLTLEKMAVHLKGYTNEQFLQFAELIERSSSEADTPLSLSVVYELSGESLGSGSRLRLSHAGGFRCTRCERSCKKLFDGFCYPCLQNSAQADRCVLNPVGCHYMRGTCREPNWGEEFCYQTHYVYLSFTDKLKVGITRKGQVPIRWIDQGATAAVLLAKVGSRHQAGLLEDLLSERYADKSHWLKMLKAGNSKPATEEFAAARAQAQEFLKNTLNGPDAAKYRAPTNDTLSYAGDIELLSSARIVFIDFPLWQSIPEKVNSLNLEKSPTIASEIFGIKGQYLFLESGVFNVRRHEGYVVECDVQR